MVRRLTWTLFIALICGNSFAQDSTWQTIQSHILDGNCANCHSAGSSFARQSGLELTADVAYEQLVDVVPTNPAARADGLQRISSTGGPVGLFQSYFWEKINTADQDHFYADHPNYGALMPLGDQSLTNGQLEFVKNWILQGAPQTGNVVDVSLLEDTSRYEPPEFRVLDPPESGIQLHLEKFEVWSSEIYDREFLYYEPYPTEEDQFISRYEISYRPGSHDFIVYHYGENDPEPRPGVYRDVRSQNGRVNIQNTIEVASLFPFRFYVGSQQPYTNYNFPAGVALRLPPGKGFDLNSHSVNRSGETAEGEVYVNLHTVDEDDIIHVAQYGSFNNTRISLPPNKETTVSRVFTFEETSHILQMWGHAHERMTEFVVEHVGGEKNGELIYWTNDWEHPLGLEFNEPLTFEKGDRVRLKTTYVNDTDEEIEFGLLSSDEMQILFFIYYTGSNLTGDYNTDGVLDVADIDKLTRKARENTHKLAFDLNTDGLVDFEDRRIWVEDLANTYFGDSNLDGVFDSSDLVAVFGVGEYEDGIDGNSTWGDGDWDGDGDFGTSDLVVAFSKDGYDKGPRAPIADVPEPRSIVLLLIGFCLLFNGCRKEAADTVSTAPVSKESVPTPSASKESDEGYLETVNQWFEAAKASGETTADNATEWLSQLYGNARDQSIGTASSIKNWTAEDIANMGAWEYRVVSVGDDLDLLEAQLNQMGKERWECFLVQRDGNRNTLLFKRSKKSFLRQLPAKELLRLVPMLNLGGDSGE